MDLNSQHMQFKRTAGRHSDKEIGGVTDANKSDKNSSGHDNDIYEYLCPSNECAV